MTAGTDAHVERFTELRPLLFTVAYEILGSATDADDVLQESYLRWADVDLDAVADSKAYLAKVVTRQALNMLRTSVRRREEYVGPWLPEPILLDERDASEDVVLAESVSTATLVVLESLGPDERAVFVLREVFGEVPELILESPEVPLEPLGVVLGHPGSIRSSGFWFPGLFGIQNCQPSSFWQQRKSC